MKYEFNLKKIIKSEDILRLIIESIVEGGSSEELINGEIRTELKEIFDFITNEKLNKIKDKQTAINYFDKATNIVVLVRKERKEIDIFLTQYIPPKGDALTGFYRVGLNFTISLEDFSFDVRVR